ncbi:MAG: hypothetical protein DMG58_28640, partial [Acidobacteria bacterium]
MRRLVSVSLSVDPLLLLVSTVTSSSCESHVFKVRLQDDCCIQQSLSLHSEQNRWKARKIKGHDPKQNSLFLFRIAYLQHIPLGRTDS